MRWAITVPNFGEYADVRRTAALAADAERAGWDGFFVWDNVHETFPAAQPMADPWVLLAAIALTTERVRIGTMVTPLARRRPWKLARETVTIDHLSQGRLTLGVGLGSPPGEEFAAFGEDPDDRVRAAKLDEGLDVLTGLWSGERFSYAGAHYELTDVEFRPSPVQQPRIPVWVAQTYPNRRPLRRAARWDGVAPIHSDPETMFASPAQVADVAGHVAELRRSTAPFDVSVPVVLPPDPAAAATLADEYRDAGATWLLVGGWSFDEIRARIDAGPLAR